MENFPDLDHDLPFDEYGKYLHTPEIEVKFAQLEESFDMNNNYVFNVQEIINSTPNRHKIAESPTDLKSFNQSLVAYL